MSTLYTKGSAISCKYLIEHSYSHIKTNLKGIANGILCGLYKLHPSIEIVLIFERAENADTNSLFK